MLKLIIIYLFLGRSSPRGSWPGNQTVTNRHPCHRPFNYYHSNLTKTESQKLAEFKHVTTYLKINKHNSNKSTKRCRQNKFQINLPKGVGSLEFLPFENVIKGVLFLKNFVCLNSKIVWYLLLVNWKNYGKCCNQVLNYCKKFLWRNQNLDFLLTT